jgi:hypothetical protein
MLGLCYNHFTTIIDVRRLDELLFSLAYLFFSLQLVPNHILYQRYCYLFYCFYSDLKEGEYLDHHLSSSVLKGI